MKKQERQAKLFNCLFRILGRIFFFFLAFENILQAAEYLGRALNKRGYFFDGII